MLEIVGIEDLHLGGMGEKGSGRSDEQAAKIRTPGGVHPAVQAVTSAGVRNGAGSLAIMAPSIGMATPDT
jgi:hypothetical protein